MGDDILWYRMGNGSEFCVEPGSPQHARFELEPEFLQIDGEGGEYVVPAHFQATEEAPAEEPAPEAPAEEAPAPAEEPAPEPEPEPEPKAAAKPKTTKAK